MLASGAFHTVKHHLRNEAWIKECREFVARVDTLVPYTNNHELNIYRKIGAILEETEEFKRAVVEGELNHIKEECMDVTFYYFSLLNYLESRCGCSLKNSLDYRSVNYKIDSLEEYLGIIKKIVRDDGDADIHKADTSLYCFVLIQLDQRMDEHFIVNMISKLVKKFPGKIREWKLFDEKHLPELQKVALNAISSTNTPNAMLWDDMRRTFWEQLHKGLDKYGTLLTINNGRDAESDLREELVDAIMYTTQLIMEGKSDEAKYLVGAFSRATNKLLGKV